MAKILILGGGFAGLIAAEKLANRLEADEHQVTLVSPSANFTFYPALVRLAFGRCEPEDITSDLSEQANLYDFRLVRGEALNINPQSRKVKIAGDDFNGEIGYDYLVIAVGRRLATEKIGGFFEHSHHFLGVRAALRFREAVQNFHQGTIVVGLCPEARLPVPVCETAFALARRFKNGIREKRVAVKIVFPESIKTAFGGAGIHRQLQSALDKHGIETVTGFAVREISEKTVISENGEEIGYDLLTLVPPFRGQTVVENIRATDGDGGGDRVADDFEFAPVDDQMRVRGLERVYAAGDIVAFSGPKLAHMAIRQAVVVAENISSEIKGKEPKKVYYHEIATIIDQGGAESMYLHYGIWDDVLYQLKEGRFWSWAKEIHDRLWLSSHS